METTKEEVKMAKARLTLKEKERLTLRKGMSKLLAELGCPSSSKTVLRVQSPEQFRTIASVARGKFKLMGSTGDPRVKRACSMVDHLVKRYEKPLTHKLPKLR